MTKEEAQVKAEEVMNNWAGGAIALKDHICTALLEASGSDDGALLDWMATCDWSDVWNQYGKASGDPKARLRDAIRAAMKERGGK